MVKKIAVIGMGVWGKKLIHEFSKIAEIKYSHSLGDRKNISWLHKNHPEIRYTNNINVILEDKEIEAVVIAVPIKSHYEIALKSLIAGKDVFIEKPLAENYSDGKKLVTLAKKKHLLLFVGHIFLYHPIIEKIKKIIVDEPIIEIFFSWEKFGSFSENIVQDLISHQISIFLDIIGYPKKIVVIEKKGFFTDVDQLFLLVSFKNNITCRIYVNRISNQKRRSVTLITKKNLYLWENELLFKCNSKTNGYKKIFEAKKTSLEIECNKFIHKSKYDVYDKIDIALKVLKLVSKIRMNL